MSKPRFRDIDVAKGVTIFLVVFGHMADPNVQPMFVGNDLYFILKKNIYSFHMPFFMFLSGMIFYLTYNPIKSYKEYFSYVVKKTKRLLPAFVIFGSIIFMGKLILLQVAHVGNFSFPNIIDAYFKLFFKPTGSFARSLWYIYVLLEYYLVFPLLMMLFRNRILPLVVIGIMIFFIPASNFLALDCFVIYFFFFSLGIVAMRHYDYFIQFIRKYNIILIGIFVFSLSFFTYSNKFLLFINGILAIPALYSVMLCRFIQDSKLLNLLGKYTFVIYLMNTLFIGLAIGVLLKFTTLTGHNFTLFLPLFVILGIFGPILIKKYFFEKFSFLRQLTN